MLVDTHYRYDQRDAAHVRLEAAYLYKVLGRNASSRMITGGLELVGLRRSYGPLVACCVGEFVAVACGEVVEDRWSARAYSMLASVWKGRWIIAYHMGSP